MTDKEFNAVLPVMQKLLWADRKDREKLQALGLNLIPTNFYSNIPSISEILSSYEYQESVPPYLDCGIFDHDKLCEELSRLIPFSADFDPPENGDEENCRSYFWKNSQFSYSDGMSYYAYLRRFQPKTVVEIGSGFSSLIAVEALRRNGSGKLKCIEPYPRPFITSLSNEGALELQTVRAQDVSPDALNAMLDDGDILFIDSTHTVKTGSDCLHIYLRLLPHINKKITVHVHDVFLPFGLPRRWMLDSQIYWTEQYLLLAFMIDNPRVNVLFGSTYHKHFNGKLFDLFMHNRVGCYLNLMSSFPKDLEEYESSYILYDNKELRYINSGKTFEVVKINDFKKFLNDIEGMNERKAEKIYLSNQKFKELITSNGGYIHRFTYGGSSFWFEYDGTLPRE